MPFDVAKSIVTALENALLVETVTVAVPASSATVTSATEKLPVSSSVIVIV